MACVLMIYKLLTIILLDSICFGLTYPFLSTHMLSHGANHITTGILASGYLLCKTISAELIPLMKYQEKIFTLITVLLTALLSHLFLMLATNYVYIIIARYIFSIVADQCRCMCTNLLLNIGKKRREDNLLMISNILNSSGYIIGPIIAGYLFSSGFSYICLLAILLTSVNIFIAITISEEYDSSTLDRNSLDTSYERTIIDEIVTYTNDTVTDCMESEFRKNWDVITVKFLHNTCMTIFYAKFTQLLVHNFMSSSVVVGYTYAYINSLNFASAYFTTSVKDRYTEFRLVILLENSIKLLSLCLVATCYSPFYTVFMIMCIPVTFLSAFINSLWTDLFALRKNDSLERLRVPLGIAADLTSPIAFGIMCNSIGHHAVIVFTVTPVVLSLCIIKGYTKFVEVVESKDKKNE